jgi:hypothetical protein
VPITYAEPRTAVRPGRGPDTLTAGRNACQRGDQGARCRSGAGGSRYCRGRSHPGVAGHLYAAKLGAV